MKQKILLMLTLLTLSTPLAAAPTASAINIFKPCTGTAASGSGVCPDATKAPSGNPIINTLKVVIDILSFVIGVAAVIILIVSGLRFVTNGGDPKGVAEARGGVINALIGIVIALLAQAIVAFVLDRIS